MRPPAPARRDLRGRRQRSPNPQHCPRLLVVLPDQVLEFRGAKGIWRLGNRIRRGVVPRARSQKEAEG